MGKSIKIIDLALLVSFIAVFGVGSICLGQDASWDLKNYHLYNAYSFVSNRLLIDIGDVMQWYINPVLDIPYYNITTIFKNYPRLIGFLQGTYLGITAYVFLKLILIIFPYNGKTWFVDCGLIIIIASTGSITLSELGTTFNDIQIAFLVFSSILLLFRSNDKLSVGDSKQKYFIASYFVMGFAVGAKLTTVVYLIGLVVGNVIFLKNNFRSAFYNYAIAALSTLIGATVSSGYWWLTLYENFNSPIFPFYNNVFKSEFWGTEPFSDQRFFPRSSMEWIFYPFYWIRDNHSLVTEVNFSDSRLALSFISLLVLLLFVKTVSFKTIIRRNRFLLFTIIFFITSYLVWLKAFSIYRYALPLEMLSVIIVYSAATLVLKNNYLRSLILVMILVILAISTNVADWGRVKFDQEYLSVNIPYDVSGSLIINQQDYLPNPISYMIKYFPESSRFILYYGGQHTHKLRESMKSKVKEHKGDYYFVGSRIEIWEQWKILSDTFGLYPLPETTRTLYTSIDGSRYCITKLTQNFYDYNTESKIAMSINEQIDFSQNGNSLLYDLIGFSNPEPYFTWTNSLKATVGFFLENQNAHSLKITLFSYGDQDVEVYLNKKLHGIWKLNQKITDQVIDISHMPTGNMEISFVLPDSKSPFSINQSDDKRNLGIAISNIKLIKYNEGHNRNTSLQ